MDQTLKIQEEFEKLVEQLEKLKKINEITSTNTEAAKEVINSVRQFINSSRELEKAILEDSEAKTRSIEGLISRLDQSLLKFEEKTAGIASEIQQELQVFQNSVTSSILELSKNTSSKLEDSNTALSKLDALVKTLIENYESNNYPERINSLRDLVESIQINSQSIQSSIDNLLKRVEQHAEKQSEYNQLLLGRLKSNKIVSFIILSVMSIGFAVLIIRAFYS